MVLAAAMNPAADDMNAVRTQTMHRQVSFKDFDRWPLNVL
jgi:hypothetical protein